MERTSRKTSVSEADATQSGRRRCSTMALKSTGITCGGGSTGGDRR